MPGTMSGAGVSTLTVRFQPLHRTDRPSTSSSRLSGLPGRTTNRAALTPLLPAQPLLGRRHRLHEKHRRCLVRAAVVVVRLLGGACAVLGGGDGGSRGGGRRPHRGSVGRLERAQQPRRRRSRHAARPRRWRGRRGRRGWRGYSTCFRRQGTRRRAAPSSTTGSTCSTRRTAARPSARGRATPSCRSSSASPSCAPSGSVAPTEPPESAPSTRRRGPRLARLARRLGLVFAPRELRCVSCVIKSC